VSIAARACLPLIAALTLAVGGCGTGSDLGNGSTTQTVSSAAGPGGVVHVVMKSLDFSPLALDARVGQRVVWTNDDAAPHNVTYVSGPAFRSSRERLTFGKRFSIKLTQAGTIHYVCTLHPWMKATIVVSP
jgi:amicyanin